MNTKPVVRYHYLDWLRVFGILLVFVYHSSRFYNVEGWTVKNDIWYPSVELWNGFATSFMMPLMFVISGASLFYALGKGGVGRFIKDKILRLLLPLVVGVLTHISLQAYLESITHGQFSGNYFQFLPQYYNLATLNWNGAHLWYLKYLFIFSILLYPLMRWLKGGGRGFLARLDGVIARTGVLYTLVFPILLLYLVLDSDGPLMAANGGYPYIMYLWFLLYGFLIVSDDRLQEKIRRLRWVSLITGLLLVIGSCIVLSQIVDQDTISPGLIMGGMMRVFGGWICVLAFFGLAMQYLTAKTHSLDYANEAVLPFYILHQTVLLPVGYFVLQWGLPEVLEWAVIVAVSFAVIMALYEFGVRRFNVMRVLFGMKTVTRPKAAPAGETAMAGQHMR